MFKEEKHRRDWSMMNYFTTK